MDLATVAAINFAPYFKDPLEDKLYEITEEGQTFEHKFGEMIDPEKTKVKVEFSSKLKDFMKYDEGSNSIVLTP